MSNINDLDLENWKNYDDVYTDSLWMIGARDNSGGHSSFYHGNFVPDIPNQLIKRFTKKDDVVLDLFLGHGTSLIEAKRLGRYGIGIELLEEVAKCARYNTKLELSLKSNTNSIIVGDSADKETRSRVEQSLSDIGKNKVHLILLHPPYHDIIKFSDRKECLSNSSDVDHFIDKFGDVISNFSDLLDEDHYLAVVIGDKYTDSQWVPLGFYLMQEVMSRDSSLALKSIVIKNMTNNRGKSSEGGLWRYRALAGGFYVFKHEYILLFCKSGGKVK